MAKEQGKVLRVRRVFPRYLRPEFLSTRDVARILQCTERTIRNYCNSGQIPGVVLIGDVWVIPLKSLDALLELRRTLRKRPKSYRIPLTSWYADIRLYFRVLEAQHILTERRKRRQKLLNEAL